MALDSDEKKGPRGKKNFSLVGQGKRGKKGETLLEKRIPGETVGNKKAK